MKLLELVVLTITVYCMYNRGAVGQKINLGGCEKINGYKRRENNEYI